MVQIIINYLLLMQSLMSGLMYHRPEDHISYLLGCLEKLRSEGSVETPRWNKFIDQRACTPLPPISKRSSGNVYRSPIPTPSRERSFIRGKSIVLLEKQFILWLLAAMLLDQRKILFIKGIIRNLIQTH